MEDEKAMCLRNTRKSTSRAEFIQKWIERQELQQQHHSSHQMQECQAQMTSNEPLSLGEATLQPSKNADSQKQKHLNPTHSLATQNDLPQSTAFDQTKRAFLDEELPSTFMLAPPVSETEELVAICTSDLLLSCPLRKRPRLLPPDRKMYLFVPKEVASCILQDSACSPTPLEYGQQPNTMSITHPPKIPKMKCNCCRLPSKLEKDSYRNDIPGYMLIVSLSPVKGINAHPSEQPVKKKHEQHQPSRSKKSAKSLGNEVAAKKSLNTSLYKHLPLKKQYTHLPPKKRYTYLLQKKQYTYNLRKKRFTRSYYP